MIRLAYILQRLIERVIRHASNRGWRLSWRIAKVGGYAGGLMVYQMFRPWQRPKRAVWPTVDRHPHRWPIADALTEAHAKLVLWIVRRRLR